MKLGLALDLGPAKGPVYEHASSLAGLLSLAEHEGYGIVWVGENYSRSSSPFHPSASIVALGFLASMTNLDLGTGVVLLGAHSEKRLRYDLASLGQLTPGRVHLGVGLGAPNLWTEFGKAAPRPNELDILLKDLRSELLSVEGDPDPYETVIPILIGGRTLASAQRAAAPYDGYILSSTYPIEIVERQVSAYDRRRRELGLSSTGRRVVINRFAIASDDLKTARSLAIDHLCPALDRYLHMNVIPQWKSAGTQEEWDRLIHECCLVGDRRSIREDLARYAEIGVTEVNVRPWFGDLPRSASLDTVAIIGDLVKAME
jgi:alkanesulfonate monooxygenase SsuD/methylene tetrahydromethanopterin reductase-like flavin-dependent oxidoreductase (luciferase family)